MTYESAGLAPALEAFVAVADTENVTAAAARLGVPQPTVSRTLARLSRELGVDLLAREGRGVRLTRQGRVLAEHAGRALAELQAGVASVRADVSAETGRVVLGFLHSMGPAVIPELLGGFHGDHPGIRIGLVQDSAERVVEDVIAGRIDLGLASPVPEHPRLRSRALARQAMVALVVDRHRLAARRRISVSDLADEPVVTMRRGYGVRTITDRLFRAAAVRPSYAFESDEMTTAAGLVAAGLGVAVLPAGAGVAGTVELALRDAGASRTISLTWSADRDPTPPVAALRRHLIAHGPGALVARGGPRAR